MASDLRLVGPSHPHMRLRAPAHTDALRPGNRVALIDADPELADGIPPTEYEHARRRSGVRVLELERPQWDPGPISRAAGPGWLGLFVLDGVLLRCVAGGGRAACEILGEGDIFHPWDEDGPYDPLAITVNWTALGSVRLAVLDDTFAARIAHWPDISASLIQRIARRARTLTLQQAIAHLPRIHSRLLLMFWLLAERWGKVTPEGVLVKLALTHQMLATAIGCQRPSATLALQRLAQNGLLIRQSADRWLLTTEAIEVLNEPDNLARLNDPRTQRAERAWPPHEQV